MQGAGQLAGVNELNEERSQHAIPLSAGYLPYLTAGGVFSFLVCFLAGWLIMPAFSLILGFGAAAERLYKFGFRGGRIWAAVAIITSVAAYFAAVPFHN